MGKVRRFIQNDINALVLQRIPEFAGDVVDAALAVDALRSVCWDVAFVAVRHIHGNQLLVFCFFGEGASNEGVTHESMNLAAVWKLPVIFVCENNGYEVFTCAEDTVSVKDVAVRAAGYDMPGYICDGNDVLEIEKCYAKAIERARKGEGPSLIECKTYRWTGHWPLDVYAYGGYRSKEEVDAWKEKCPVKRLGEHLVANGIKTQEEIDEIRAKVEADVEASIEYAFASPEPALEEARKNVFQE